MVPTPSTNPTPNGVGGEWAYNNTQSVGGANEGISSAGFGAFGVGDRFPGNNLQGPGLGQRS